MRKVVEIRSGEKAEVRVLKPPNMLDPAPQTIPQVAEVVVEVHGGRIQVFVHRREDCEYPVETFVV